MSLHKLCFSHSNSDLPDFQFDQLSEEDTLKTLADLWNSSDAFLFYRSYHQNLVCTKRNVLFSDCRPFRSPWSFRVCHQSCKILHESFMASKNRPA
ncbi:hypothetical protein NPIL_532551 [Nephila pilipes]|uniref:Uncharacterized protein n=1 Tax=Nephila pilipes TaxID=299642 RepID=A0A8X6QZA5_NEPPI|nr:hypothetical protein NPIL_532551 [Nephila pilipes]